MNRANPTPAPARVAGFTLIELMMVLVIVAVLLTVGLPMYNEQTSKARRTEGKVALAGLAVALERYRAEQSPSTYTGATLGSDADDIFPDEAPVDRSNKFYDLTLSIPTGDTFLISAVPKGAQSGDQCGTLTINSEGERTPANEACWR